MATIKYVQIEGSDVMMDLEANNNQVVSQMKDDLDNITDAIDAQIMPKLNQVKTSDSLIDQSVLDNNYGGCDFTPANNDLAITNKYDYYIKTGRGIKLSGICLANWDRTGMSDIEANYDILHVDQTNYKKLKLIDFTSAVNGTIKSNWKNSMAEWEEEGSYLFVIDQGVDGKRFKIEFPDNIDCDYFTITGIAQNGGETTVLPCNNKLLAIDDATAKFTGEYSTRTYTLLGTHRKAYYLECNVSKKLWANIKFYKFNDPTKYPTWVENENELDDPNAVESTVDYEVLKLYTVTTTDVNELSGLCLNKDKTSLIGISDSEGLWNIGFKGLTTEIKSDLKMTIGDEQVYPDFEGVTMDHETGDLYACVEFSATGTNDIVKIAAPNYDTVTVIGSGLKTLGGVTAKSNTGFEGIALYKKTADDVILIVGNQNNPLCVIFYSVKNKAILDTVNITFSGEIGDLSYENGFLWIIDSLNGDIHRCFVDETVVENTTKYSIVEDTKFRMIFDSGNNENPESICSDCTHKTLWVGTEIGKRLYNITLPVSNLKTLTGKDVTTNKAIANRYEVTGDTTEAIKADKVELKWTDGEVDKVETIENAIAFKAGGKATIKSNGIYKIAQVIIEGYGAGKNDIDISTTKVTTETKFGVTTDNITVTSSAAKLAKQTDTTKPVVTTITLTPATPVHQIGLINGADKKAVLTKITIITDDYLAHRNTIEEGKIVLNEIDILGNYNGNKYVELYNAHTEAIDISGAYIKVDNTLVYTFGSSTNNLIPAKSKLMVTCDKINVTAKDEKFKIELYDEADNKIDSLDTNSVEALQKIKETGKLNILQRSIDGAGTWRKFDLNNVSTLTLVDEIANSSSTARISSDMNTFAVSQKGIDIKVLTSNWDRTDITASTTLTINDLNGTYTWTKNNEVTSNWCKTVKCDKNYTGEDGTAVKLSEDASHYIAINDKRDINAEEKPIKVTIPKGIKFDYVVIEGYGHKGNGEPFAVAFDAQNIVKNPAGDIVAMDPQWKKCPGASVFKHTFKRLTTLSETDNTVIYLCTSGDYAAGALFAEKIAKTKVWMNLKFYAKN